MGDGRNTRVPKPSLSRVLFAGGGTGGHVYMAVALRAELLRRGLVDCLFVGTKRGLEMKILPPLNFPLETINIGGIQNLSLARRLSAVLRLPGSFLRSRKILTRFRPQVVVGLGGYSAGPVVAAARFSGYRSVLIEPNVVPGLTNRLLSPWVQGAAVAFEETLKSFRKRARLTGIPIRPEFHELSPSDATEKRLRILIFGGSRGSHPLNNLICEALPELDPKKVSLCHQTGKDDLQEVQAVYRKLNFPGDVRSYLEDMPAYFEQADLIVARSGASTVAEITAAGRASILIPFPYAADDHQTRNAQALASRGAAILLPQSQTDGVQLAQAILRLEANRSEVSKMARTSRSLARRNSAVEIVELLEEVAFS